MFDRLANSWRLIKYSATVLKKDTELLVFPLISGIAALLVLASFILLFIQTPESEDETINMLVVGGFYLVEYFVMFFFNSALVGAAMIRMDGGNPGIGDGLRIAWSKVGQIFGYALVAATVGMLLRFVGRRFGFVGRLIAGLSGVAWTVASYLAVPILVSRDVGPLDAIKESVSLLKKTWGENLIVSGGLGLVFNLVYIVLVGLLLFTAGSAFAASQIELAIGIVSAGVLMLLLTGLMQAAMQGIFSTALYRFATDGQVSEDFSPQVLSNAFAPKDRFISATNQQRPPIS